MSRKQGRDYVYLIWKEPITRRNYIVGQLSQNGQFEFSYGHEVKEAISKGFELLINFDNLEKIYKSDSLFPVFSSRLPDRKRRDISQILSKYNLDQYDEYKLLKRSRARLPIDNLEFIDPIFDRDEGKMKRIFYVEGPRYYIGCEGDNCQEALYLEKGDSLELFFENENEHDKNAIKILDSDKNTVGYLPRYYCVALRNWLKRGADYTCTVLEMNKSKACSECIKVNLEVLLK